MLIDWITVRKHCPKITGILHIGAHRAEERFAYYPIPAKWVEADYELYEKLPVPDKYWFAAVAEPGIVHLNLMPFKAANSLLLPNLNAKRRADVYVEDVVAVPGERIDSIQTPKYNFLNLDIQGAELGALKGTNLKWIDYIYTEVHRVPTYHDCTQIDQLDDYLEGFERVVTEWTKHGWGDALYVRL